MQIEYDDITAHHYAAYRPALHLPILKSIIPSIESLRQIFRTGLDIGCGTGHSTIALSHFCNNVIGIDPNKAMINSARSINPKISFQHQEEGKLAFANDSLDIVTFAGSLHYAKSKPLGKELVRVCKSDGHIIVYDFDIKLDSIFTSLGISLSDLPNSNYNHQEDLSGLEEEHLTLMDKSEGTIPFQLSASELTHLILSVKDYHSFFYKKWGREKVFQNLSSELDHIHNTQQLNLIAETYSTTYIVKK